MSERCETDKTPQAKANATDKFNSIARHNQRHCLFNNAATTNQAIFSAIFNSLLEKNHQGFGDTFFIDEVFVKIDGKQRYLWRAVDQDGEIVDVFLQRRRDSKAAKRFFKRLLKEHRMEPRKIVTDKLRSYGVAHRELIPDTIHVTSQYANNRAELSHQPTRVRERVMRRFKSIPQAQRFLSVHAAVYNLFNLGRHLVSAKNYRVFRSRAFASWDNAAAV